MDTSDPHLGDSVDLSLCLVLSEEKIHPAKSGSTTEPVVEPDLFVSVDSNRNSKVLEVDC